MKTTWINTSEFYHRIIDAPDMATREQRYRESFVHPWKPMMDMVSGMMNTDASDDLAGARAWNWLLPENLTEVPDALRKLEAADAWIVGAAALAEGAHRFEPYTDRVPMESAEGWLVLADPARSDPIGRGYTGAIDFMQPRFITQYDTPNDYNIPRLPGAVVHEFHHLIRLRLFPWDMQKTTVADYIIVEGLAESFAAALFGEDIVGYYVTDIDESDLDIAKTLIRDGLNNTGFNIIRSYIFGDAVGEKHGLPLIGMPAYGGYAIGYRVVQAFLERSGQSIEAATFLPADEIVVGSGFFD